ncbi:hypothetical protein V6N11_057193 [Hibiscus sabdariffa]|uniref:X8 domain-containing protein n=1 Tax=Hibiscus sabdariffa TaxID=183260 RepID=A0ABR2NKJ7_9ROSI
MELLSRACFLLLATVVFHLFSSAPVVESYGVVLPDGSTLPRQWCVAKPGVSDADLQGQLDWACSQKEVDCGPIQPGAACAEPVTVRSRASFAMNAYFQKHDSDPNSCNFSGNAMVVSEDPSKLNTFGLVMENANISEELDKERSVMREGFALL